jgi:large subunit ribosomal protein L19
MSNNKILNSSVVQSQLKTDLPNFTSGSVVNVYYRIIEGVNKDGQPKERIQIYSGIVIKIHNKKSLDTTFKVLKVASGGIKTVRTFPLHSPFISKIEIVNRQRGRRASLYYLMDVKDPIKSLRAKPVKATV